MDSVLDVVDLRTVLPKHNKRVKNNSPKNTGHVFASVV